MESTNPQPQITYESRTTEEPTASIKYSLLSPVIYHANSY